MNRIAPFWLSALLALPASAVEVDKALPPAPPALEASAVPTQALPEIPVLAAQSAQAAPSAVPAAAAQAQAPAATLLSPRAGESAAVARVRAHVAEDLRRMAGVSGDHPLLQDVARSADSLLSDVDAHLKAGEIDPSVDLRLSESDAPRQTSRRVARVGFYPVAGDPLTWAHTLVGLQAIARLKLDKVVYVLAGDDPRKPQMTKADLRHPMGRAVLDAFAPFFAYSPLAMGTTLDGESNVFRFLDLNLAQPLKAFYIVGDDHYRRFDKKGNPDTLTKIENKLALHRETHPESSHEVSLAFNEREGVSQLIDTSLDVRFLPRMAFEASSTMVRGGVHVLMPHTAYQHALMLGLYNLPMPEESQP